MKIRFTLNGKETVATFEPGEILFDFLRKQEVYSVKKGCDLGECGACTVIVNGATKNSCLLMMHTLQGLSVETVENLGTMNNLHPLQQKFLEEGAVQCGYCTPGMILSAEALLRKNSNPSEGEVRDALAGNLCRCTGYVKPVRAICNE